MKWNNLKDIQFFFGYDHFLCAKYFLKIIALFLCNDSSFDFRKKSHAASFPKRCR